MGEINLSQNERDAIVSIDADDLRRRVEQAIRNESLGDLHLIPLDACGPYVHDKTTAFRNALSDQRRAKSDRKRADASNRLHRASLDLSYAVDAMKRRLEEEEKEGQLFRVDDEIFHPAYLSDQLDLTVRYRWRKRVGDEWAFGSITFTHVVDSRPDHRFPPPKRKPSAARLEEERREKRDQAWEHLTRTALCSVRDFLRDGGDGNAIPKTFKAVVDHAGYLNNHSARFWMKP